MVVGSVCRDRISMIDRDHVTMVCAARRRLVTSSRIRLYPLPLGNISGRQNVSGVFEQDHLEALVLQLGDCLRGFRSVFADLAGREDVIIFDDYGSFQLFGDVDS